MFGCLDEEMEIGTTKFKMLSLNCFQMLWRHLNTMKASGMAVKSKCRLKSQHLRKYTHIYTLASERYFQWTALTFVTVLPSVTTITFTVRPAQSQKPAFSMFASDVLTRIKQLLFLIAQHISETQLALTAIWEGIDGHTNAIHAPESRSKYNETYNKYTHVQLSPGC